MDSEARVYLVLVVVLLVLLLIVGRAFFWALYRGDRYEASAKAARKAAAQAAGERDAMRRVVADIRRAQADTATIPAIPRHAVPADAPTVLVPRLRDGVPAGQLNGHNLDISLHEAT